MKEIEFTKIKLAPGETLFVELKGEEFLNDSLTEFSQRLKNTFPENGVIVVAVPPEHQISFKVIGKKEVNEIIENSCSSGNFCSDCNCGKKEQYEGDLTVDPTSGDGNGL